MIFSPKAWFRAQLAPYLKIIRQRVDVAGGAWPLVFADPQNPAPGYPWLLQREVLGAVPAGVRASGFGRLSVLPLQAKDVVLLSVKTSSGQIARFTTSSME